MSFSKHSYVGGAKVGRETKFQVTIQRSLNAGSLLSLPASSLLPPFPTSIYIGYTVSLRSDTTRQIRVPKDWVSWNLPRIRIGLLRSSSAQDRRGRQLLKGTTFIAATLRPSERPVLAAPLPAASRRAQHRKFSKNSRRRRDKRCLWDRSWGSSRGPRSRGSGDKIEIPRRCAPVTGSCLGRPLRRGEGVQRPLGPFSSAFVLLRCAVLSHSLSAVFIYTCGARPGGR